jgi:hypothetical protein
MLQKQQLQWIIAIPECTRDHMYDPKTAGAVDS